MKHTKNILKSLLIMIVAISLFTVSCSKDEGGSKPTNPTSITIDAATLDGAIKLAATTKLAANEELKNKVTFDFSSFTSANGKGNASATVDAAVEGNVLKTALEKAFKLDTGDYSSTADAGTIQNTDKKADLTITITLNGNNTFASDVTPKYEKVAGNSKSVKTVITITPNDNKGWNAQQ